MFAYLMSLKPVVNQVPRTDPAREVRAGFGEKRRAPVASGRRRKAIDYSSMGRPRTEERLRSSVRHPL